MAATFTIHQAKTQLSKLIARAEAGEEIVIARGKEPAVRLQPLKPRRRPRFGELKGLSLPDSFFFDPLPEDELALFEGRDDDPLR
jgi:prevent-host-death family protein